MFYDTRRGFPRALGSMFTFGRDHEKISEARYVRKPEQIPLLMSVIDAVHDLIEGKGDEDFLKESIRVAFTEGGSGVWENAGKWLRKCDVEFPGTGILWREFAAHAEAEVRFRAACFLDEMPKRWFTELSPALMADRSKKVARMASARAADVERPDAA